MTQTPADPACSPTAQERQVLRARLFALHRQSSAGQTVAAKPQHDLPPEVAQSLRQNAIASLDTPVPKRRLRFFLG